METFTFFAKTKVIHSSVKLAEKIKKWFIDEKKLPYTLGTKNLVSLW